LGGEIRCSFRWIKRRGHGETRIFEQCTALAGAILEPVRCREGRRHGDRERKLEGGDVGDVGDVRMLCTTVIRFRGQSCEQVLAFASLGLIWMTTKIQERLFGMTENGEKCKRPLWSVDIPVALVQNEVDNGLSKTVARGFSIVRHSCTFESVQRQRQNWLEKDARPSKSKLSVARLVADVRTLVEWTDALSSFPAQRRCSLQFRTSCGAFGT
jgi:hypothetical protein